MRKLWLGLLLACVLPASASGAEVEVTKTPTIQKLLAMAQVYWHYSEPECAGGIANVKVVVVDTPPESPNEQAWADVGGCVIHMTPELWASLQPSSKNLLMAWGCLFVFHEYGHLIGLRHSPNQRATMYYAPNEIPLVCENWAAHVALSQLAASEAAEVRHRHRHHRHK